MAVLQAAADAWNDKCIHWNQYCEEQHYAKFNPVFVIQVQNGTGEQVSATDLDDCLVKIEQRLGIHFSAGEVGFGGDRVSLLCACMVAVIGKLHIYSVRH